VYETKFGDVRLPTHQPSATSNEGKNKMAWDDIYGDDIAGSSFPSSSTTSWEETSQSKLSSYLDSDTVNQFDDSFNILS
jgi:hypothetical protein